MSLLARHVINFDLLYTRRYAALLSARSIASPAPNARAELVQDGSIPTEDEGRSNLLGLVGNLATFAALNPVHCECVSQLENEGRKPARRTHESR